MVLSNKLFLFFAGCIICIFPLCLRVCVARLPLPFKSYITYLLLEVESLSRYYRVSASACLFYFLSSSVCWIWIVLVLVVFRVRVMAKVDNLS